MVALRPVIDAQRPLRVNASGLMEAAPVAPVPSPLRSVSVDGYTIEPAASGSVVLLDSRGQSFGCFTNEALARSTLKFLSR